MCEVVCVYVTMFPDRNECRSERLMKVIKNPMLSANHAVEFRRGSEELKQRGLPSASYTFT